MFLRQSTIQTIFFGPFVDDTDGVTAETALTIAQADRQISKDGAAFAQSGETGNSTHGTDGWYTDNLTAADTDTVGELYLQVKVAGALPVWVRYYVVEEAVYDDLFAASADPFTVMQSDAAAIESELIVVHSDTTAIHSDTTIIASDVVIVVSDTTAIHSQTTVIESDSITIQSSLVVVESQTTVIESDVALFEAAHSEPTGVPAANESPLDKLAYLFMVMRNRKTVTSTKKTIFGDDDVGEWEHDLSDDSTTYDESEANAI